MITKTCLGFSIGIVALSAIVEIEILSRFVSVRRNVFQFTLITGATGCLTLLLGLLQKARYYKADGENRTARRIEADYRPLAFFRDLKYWGTILIILSIVGYFVPLYGQVKARPRGDAPASGGVVKFPPMRLQGIVLRGDRSSVMINNEIYFVGSYVGDARVVAISRDSVTLELAGQTNVLTLKQ